MSSTGWHLDGTGREMVLCSVCYSLQPVLRGCSLMAAEASVKCSVNCLEHRTSFKKKNSSTLWPVWLLCHMNIQCARNGMGMWCGERGRKLVFSRALTLTWSCSLWNCFHTLLLDAKWKPRENWAPQCHDRANQWEKATYCLIQINAVQLWGKKKKKLFQMLPRISWTLKPVINTTDKVYYA